MVVVIVVVCGGVQVSKKAQEAIRIHLLEVC